MSEIINEEVKIKPLSVNVCWQGRRFKTYDYKKYEQELLLIMPEREMIEGDLEVDIKFYIKHPMMCDSDNFIKPLFDIISKKGWWKDDRYVFKTTIEKIKSDEDKIKIVIKKYEDKK